MGRPTWEEALERDWALEAQRSKQTRRGRKTKDATTHARPLRSDSDYTPKGPMAKSKRILEFIQENTYPPTRREIQAACGISSLSVVTYHLLLMQQLGMITLQPETARGIRLCAPQGVTP